MSNEIDYQLRNSYRPDALYQLCEQAADQIEYLAEQNKKWFEAEIQTLIDKSKKPKKKVVVKEENTAPVVTIQDRIREKASECIGELEGQLDDYILSEFKADAKPYTVMHTLNIKSVHVKPIVEFAKKRRNEFEQVMDTTDKQLKEGYSNFTKTQLKKVVAWCDQIILDTQKIMGAAAENRKPRKRKQKSPEELVAKVKVLDKFEELKLESIATKSIIGATQLWVYNTKTKKLGCYHAEDAGGFSVKGSSLAKYSESKSMMKTLRKPEVVLPQVLKAGKVALRNVLSDLTTKESALTGRFNSDIILVRVV